MKRLLSAIALVLSICFVTSCAPPYRQTFTDACKDKGWTNKQCNAAFASADRTFWSREVSENKYIISYGKVPTSKVRSQLEGVLKDLDNGLDPKNTDNKQYLDTFNLRKDMEHDEEVTQAIYDRVRAAELQAEFKQKMGDSPEYGPEAELAQGYNVRKIFVAKSLVDAFPFTSDQIEAAKKSGTLKKIASASLDESVQYDHKASDPQHPNDENEFVWKARNQKIELTEYKIIDVDKPLDNKGDYIEGYRVLEGKRESVPALKVFFPSSGSMAIVLVDTDEEGQPGFGIPNFINDMSELTDVKSLVNNNDLLNSLFDKKESKKNREIVESTLFKIEIAPLGGHADEWQKSPDASGWVVPFKYVNERGDNFNVRVHYKKLNLDPEQLAHFHSEYMELDYIEKEFTRSGERYEASAGRVIEYYRPKKDFSGKVKASVLFDDNTKRLQFQFEDGSVVEGFITSGKNKFIEDLPYAKSYNEGQKRWWIESRGASCCVYDSRKSVGQPKEETGEYHDDEQEEAMREVSPKDRGQEETLKPRIRREIERVP